MLVGLEAPAETRYVTKYHLAMVYVALGDTEKALDQLERAEQELDHWFNWLAVEPRFAAALRGEPRFEAMVERLGL